MAPVKEELESSFFSGPFLKYFKKGLLLRCLKAIWGVGWTLGLLLSSLRLFQYLDQLLRNGGWGRLNILEVANPVYNELRAKWKESAWCVWQTWLVIAMPRRQAKGERHESRRRKDLGRKIFTHPKDKMFVLGLWISTAKELIGSTREQKLIVHCVGKTWNK